MTVGDASSGEQISNLLDQVVERLKTTFGNLGGAVVNGVRAGERDLELRMYEQASLTSAQYALDHMVTARPVRRLKYAEGGGGGRLELLEVALSLVKIDGFHAEFGVYRGETFTFLADRIDQVIYGFDSFEGLPEDWFLGVGKGAFSLNGERPELKTFQGNFRLVKGWFAQTIPMFRDQVPGPAAFLHIDCHLHASAKAIFDGLGDRIVPGTVLVIDKYLNYPGWQNHTFKAFQAFCEARRIKYRYVAFAPTMFSVALVVEAVG